MPRYRYMALRKQIAELTDGGRFGPNCIIALIADEAELKSEQEVNVEFEKDFARISLGKTFAAISCVNAVSAMNPKGQIVLRISQPGGGTPIELQAGHPLFIDLPTRFLTGLLAGLNQSDFMTYVSHGAW